MAGETQVVFSYPGTPIPGGEEGRGSRRSPEEAECEPKGSGCDTDCNVLLPQAWGTCGEESMG